MKPEHVAIRVNPWLTPSVDLILSISSRLSFVCVAVSGTLQQLRYEPHGFFAPVRKRTQRVGDVPCVPYEAAFVQICPELFIGKTTAQTSGGNCQRRCNFYWPATKHHMPRAFRQRIRIRKRKLATR